MNYVYTITDRPDSSLFKRMIDSLTSRCNFTLLLNIFSENKDVEDYCRAKMRQSINVHYIDRKNWSNKRMAYKVENILAFPFSQDDCVFVLDDDLLIRDDIFTVFRDDFDICVTSRHYPYWYPINAGVWGFKVSEASRAFLNFYVAQIRKPTWEPLVSFRNRFCRTPSLDWWVDQDFLCAVHSNKLPFQCKVRDIGPMYNFCPSVEEDIPGTFEKARQEILLASQNPDVKILHLKGRLKTTIGSI